MKYYFRFFLFIACFCGISHNINSQNFFTSIPDSLWFAQRFDSLRNVAGKGVQAEGVAALPLYAAMCYYPDLLHQKVKVKYRKISTTMAARPSNDFLFRHRNRRAYILFINNSERFEGMKFRDMDFIMQLGIMGHELAHVADYRTKSAMRLCGNAVAYVFSGSFRRNLEHATDQQTINRGLGRALHVFVKKLLHDNFSSEAYKEKKRKYYYDDNQILELVLEYENRIKPVN